MGRAEEELANEGRSTTGLAPDPEVGLRCGGHGYGSFYLQLASATRTGGLLVG